MAGRGRYYVNNCCIEIVNISTTFSLNMEEMVAKKTVGLLELPPEIVEHILSFLTYDEISQTRHVCKTFDRMCRRFLNQGFKLADRLRASVQRDVKARLPRRESERRAHRLSRHADVLTAIETRISLLSMTYMKYIDLDLCCFIPGKVLDELFRVLRVMKQDAELPPSTDLLQELRDISSMAMEHFDDVITPGLKHLLPPLAFGPSLIPSPTSSGGLSLCDPNPPSPVAKDVNNMQLQMAKLKKSMSLMSSCFHNRGKVICDLKAEICKQKRKLVEQDKKILEQSRVIANHTKTLQDYDAKMNDLSTEILEMKQLLADHDFHVSAKSSKSEETHQEGFNNDANKETDIRKAEMSETDKNITKHSAVEVVHGTSAQTRRKSLKRVREQGLNKLEENPYSKRLRGTRRK